MDSDWTPPFTLAERLKYALVPPKLYMWRLVRKNLRKGEPELHLLPRLVPRDKMAIDVGANKGVYTHVLSKLCAGVEAFEPNPKIHRILIRALPKNALTPSHWRTRAAPPSCACHPTLEVIPTTMRRW